jgi:hypothetical protein
MLRPVTAFACLILAVSSLRAADDTDRTGVTGNSVSFRYDVLAAVSKQGCSAGMCHGSPAGKGGFLLSLRGFDPTADYDRIVKGNGGRRVSIPDPLHSLLLRKPTMQVAHGGGRKLRASDPAWSILENWIAAGCPDDPPDVAHCDRIEFDPIQFETRWPAHTRRLRVRAFFTDGTMRDVTHLTLFTSSSETVATVSVDGLVTSARRGETTIVARYLDFIATADLRFVRPVDGFEWSEPGQPVIAAASDKSYRQFAAMIDRHVFDRLQKLQILPSPICSDSEFIRRVSLDVLGGLPDRDEVEHFLKDQSPDKRGRLIDSLLGRPEYAEYLAQKWGDRLRVNVRKLSLTGVHKFNAWLTASMRDNISYDRLAAELLTAEGSTFVNPPAGFFRAAADPRDCAETVAQLFLGVRIQCARCHNHPFDRWSQDNYYGIGAVFARVQRRPIDDSGEILVSLDRHGELTNPRTEQASVPWVPAADDFEADKDPDRRAAFARWLTSADNPFFARVAVNRIWADLLGRGIVDPPDDFRADNPPAHPELLDELAAAFVAAGFDQKELIRGILNSRIYQLSSRTNGFNQDDTRYFSHASARLLTAEQLLDAISHVTGVPERFVGLPAGTHATALPSPDFGNDFLKLFGQPARNTVCECERSDDPKLSQALQLINGPIISGKLRDSRSRLSRLLDNVPARVIAAGQPPTEGLAAWFKAEADALTSGDQLAHDGATVARWLNQIRDPGDADVRQSNNEQQPVFIASSIGGLPALRFDGSNDLLHNTDKRLLPSGSPRTIVVVGRLADSVGGALFTFGRQRTGGSSVFAAQHVRIGGQYYVYSDGVNGAGNTTAPDDQFDHLKRPFMTTFISAGTGSKLRVRVNGTDVATQQAGSVGIDTGAAGFTIGSREDIPPGQQIWNGDLSEVLVYDRALDDDDITAVGSYLTTKYDLRESKFARRKNAESSKIAAASDVDIVMDLYFAAFSRPPSAAEIDVARRHIASSQDHRQALEDIAWALLNSQEFLFQH